MTTNAATMTIQDALAELGADPQLLTAEDRRCLDEDGYLVIPNVLSHDELVAIRERLDTILEAEGDNAGIEVHQEAGTDRLASLVAKGSEFRPMYGHPKFLAAVAHILDGDVRFSGLSARFAKPGEGLQALHRDYENVATPGVWEAVNSVWMLDDYTDANGATRVVPGSHRWPTNPPAAEAGGAFVSDEDKQHGNDDLRNPARNHPGQKLVVAKAGTVAVFNCMLWHSGTLNKTDKRRRGVYSSYVRRDHWQLDVAGLTEEILSTLSPAERFLMGV